MARRKRRTAAQKAATRKMIAANRRRRGGSTSTKRRRRRNPSTVQSNPRRRRRRSTTVRRRRSSSRRRNPSLSLRSVQSQVMEAGVGALGALALDVAQGYLPIPANLKGGIVGTGVKALLAIGIGVVGSKVKVVRPATAAKMANGALTVVLHDELKRQVQNFAPGIQMGEYLGPEDGLLGWAGSGWDPNADPNMLSGNWSMDMDSFDTDSFGEYLQQAEYAQ